MKMFCLSIIICLFPFELVLLIIGHRNHLFQFQPSFNLVFICTSAINSYSKISRSFCKLQQLCFDFVGQHIYWSFGSGPSTETLINYDEGKMESEPLKRFEGNLHLDEATGSLTIFSVKDFLLLHNTHIIPHCFVHFCWMSCKCR